MSLWNRKRDYIIFLNTKKNCSTPFRWQCKQSWHKYLLHSSLSFLLYFKNILDTFQIVFCSYFVLIGNESIFSCVYSSSRRFSCCDLQLIYQSLHILAVLQTDFTHSLQKAGLLECVCTWHCNLKIPVLSHTPVAPLSSLGPAVNFVAHSLTKRVLLSI